MMGKMGADSRNAYLVYLIDDEAIELAPYNPDISPRQCTTYIYFIVTFVLTPREDF